MVSQHDPVRSKQSIEILKKSDPQTLHGLRDVELVHGVHNDGRSGEKEEQQEEEDVEENTSEPPARAADRQVLPGEVRDGI